MANNSYSKIKKDFNTASNYLENLYTKRGNIDKQPEPIQSENQPKSDPVDNPKVITEKK